MAIESVNVLDLTPPASIAGVGTGVAHLVAEFEDGPFSLTHQVLDASDLLSTFGGFGYTYGTAPAQNPCARSRSADSAPTPENWNGNGALALNGKQFAQLLVTRVNTSIGAVTFTPLAYVEAQTAYFTYQLATGQILGLNLGSGAVSTTFTGVAATVTGTAVTNPTLFTGVESVTLGYDAAANFTVFFQAADQTPAQVVARINQYAGFTFAVLSTSSVKLTGLVAGTAGQVRVVAFSSGGVGTTLGLTVANTGGTGNVGNIAAVQFSEVQSLVQTAMTAHVAVELNPSTGVLRVSNTQTPGTGTVTVDVATTTAAGLGFVAGATSNAANTPAGVLPAGTVVQNSGATVVLVTMQSVAFGSATAGLGGGAVTIPVRFALDDGTGVGTTPGAITKIPTPPVAGAFGVINLATIANALTDAQIDALYVAALAPGGPTTDTNTVSKTTNIIWAARHSNAVRSALRTNALYSSSKGCFGRVACVSPPLNTAPATALSTTVAPGVGATRSDRVVYCYVGANVFVPPMALVGLAGGAGFTASGNINQTSDGWMASQLSQLNPEENPGQVTNFLGAINSIETGANVQGFDMDTYVLFRAAGIAALRWDSDDGTAIFQSGVTSVDPQVNPALVNVSRRRMADFIQDSIAAFCQGYVKRLATSLRKQALRQAITRFLNGLLSPDNPGQQRIAGYSPSKDVGNANTPPNMFRISVNVKLLDSMDSIVPVTLIGDNVSVTVVPQAA